MGGENKLVYMDRSRTEAKQQCLRKGYWNYYYKGRGIVPSREMPPAWPLLTGGFVHEGIESILRTAASMELAPAAVAVGMGVKYVHKVQPLFDQIEEGPARDNLLQTLKEQSELTTALIYGWWKVIYPDYIAQFEPIDIEREEEIVFTVGETELALLTRTDLLSKVRGGDNHVLHNWKTTTQADKTWLDQWRYDQQTLTEFIAVENRLGKAITGTIITGLIKGRKTEWPEDSGNWSHNSSLIYAWVKDNGGSYDYKPKYKWKCDSPHSLSRGSKLCPGGQNHTASGYFKAAVADRYPGGIISWIDSLYDADPGIVQSYFITLPPISRSEWEVERWKRQTLAREVADVERAEEINRLVEIEPDTAALLLDYHFPMVTGHGNCIRMSKCSYLDVCWGSADVDDLTVFKPREFNHPKEGEGR